MNNVIEFGHQYKADQKALEAAKDDLQSALLNLREILNNSEVDEMKSNIVRLITQCESLSYSANERYEQNS